MAVLAVVLVGILFVRTANAPTHAIKAEIATTTASSTAPLPVNRNNLYKVVHVVDGDTVVVSIGGKNTTLRLIGLDTPETVDPRKPVQCFGREASAKAKGLLSRQTVRLEFDASQGTLDKYGRTLAYLFLPDGTFFNKYMIAEGFAHEYTYNIPYAYQKEFKAAETSAREQKKGLWAEDACAQESSRTPPPPAAAAPVSGTFECAYNAYNCASFTSQAAAQQAFDACGGRGNDVHQLDRDGDGRVCETLP